MIDRSTVWQKTARPLAAMTLCCAALVSLQGCVGVMVGGAVMGTLAATDRRTLGAQTEDKTIAVKGDMRLSRLLGDAAHINVNSFNRRVLLTGEVPNEQAKTDAEREMRAVEGVESITNELQVAGVSNYTSRSNDALITGKVKASFVDTKDLYASALKVVTESNAVYLMGRVTQREGNLAGEVASGVSGVRKVVKVFDYISEGELKSMMTTPDTTSTKQDSGTEK
ncbi:BON domain-containing protein [Undibacterium sp.]|uniref:BON domain-containing protein n=1 Tax=Undibacterium sp. TaxID=1914977 RepID=UPI002BDD974C|nr:BON domain-containing protein [Undibacterium sp.]HTD07091.1 BON domain-containing protein [Undibacterium sp.]